MLNVSKENQRNITSTSIVGEYNNSLVLTKEFIEENRDTEILELTTEITREQRMA